MVYISQSVNVLGSEWTTIPDGGKLAFNSLLSNNKYQFAEGNQGGEVDFFPSDGNVGATAGSFLRLDNFKGVELFCLSTGLNGEGNAHNKYTLYNVTAEHVKENAAATFQKNGQTFPKGLFIMGDATDTVDLSNDDNDKQDPNGNTWVKQQSDAYTYQEYSFDKWMCGDDPATTVYIMNAVNVI